MAGYRIYYLDPDNHIIGFEEDEYPSDAKAVAHASTVLADHYGIEIWSGARRIGRLAGAKAAPGAAGPA